MQILLVSHQYPPESSAGTETYTAELAGALARRGHAVEVFASVKDISRTHLSISTRVHAGIPVHEVVNNLFHHRFEETWNEPRIERAFARLLERVRPDLVHFQHLLYLSAGCVGAARARGTPVVFTLHDYWLQCPRFGQRVHADGLVCDTIDFARCGTCLATFKHAQTPLERRLGRVIARVRSGTGIDLGGLARGTRGAFVRRGAPRGRPRPGPAPAEGTPEASLSAGDTGALAEAARRRSAELHRLVVPNVDLFLAPSRFLRERMVAEWGLPAERVEHWPFGIDLERFGTRPRTRAEPAGVVRIAFVGSLIPVKGAHVLLEAWSLLAPSLRERARLSIRGPSQYDPGYHATLVRRATELGVEVGGALSRGGVAEALASTDLLVVPSLWFENAPLVILEALAARTPLLVSDLGGMAELVEEGRDGWRFRMGDARDLARVLAARIERPEELARIARRERGTIALPSFDEHVAGIESRYARLAARRR